jgi:hypothetical protein
MDDLDQPRRCTTTNRAGERCGRAPIVGGSVCVMHGGGVPAVKQKAAERMLAMLEPALDVVYRALHHGPRCEHCGRSDDDRNPVAVGAAFKLFDRTGFHPTLTVQQLEAPRVPEHFAWVPYERLKQMTLWLAEAKADMERGAPRADALPALPEGTLDAVVITEPDPQGYAPVGVKPK